MTTAQIFELLTLLHERLMRVEQSAGFRAHGKTEEIKRTEAILREIELVARINKEVA